MLQRRRCRCCVSGIIILVISISVFYFSSTFSGLSGGGYVDVVRTYPDYRKYAKNLGDSLGGVNMAYGSHSHEESGGKKESHSLQGVPLRLLMDTNDDNRVVYSPIKSRNSDTTKTESSQESLIRNVPNSQNFTRVSDVLKDEAQLEGMKEVPQVKVQSAAGYKLSVSYNKNASEPLKVPVEDAQTRSDNIANKTTDKLPQDTSTIKPTQIIIITNRRSGSSFLGQLFNQNPNIFFHFEPLKVTEWKKELYPNATALLQNILKCRFDSTPFLMDMYNRESLHRESSKVLTSPPLCDLTKIENTFKPVRSCPPLNTKVVTDVCNRYKHMTVKMIRMYSLSSLEDIVTDPALNVKVIHLVRDPRGIYVSRAKAEHKRMTPGEALDKDVTYTCRRMKRNLAFLQETPEWLQGRYKRIRYEDLAQDPVETAQRLYNFSGLGPVPVEINEWIRANTHGTRGDAYSTQRNSSSAAQAWRKSVPLDIVKHMQDLCRPLLGDLGYLEVTTETELRDTTHSLVI